MPYFPALVSAPHRWSWTKKLVRFCFLYICFQMTYPRLTWAFSSSKSHLLCFHSPWTHRSQSTRPLYLTPPFVTREILGKLGSSWQLSNTYRRWAWLHINSERGLQAKGLFKNSLNMRTIQEPFQSIKSTLVPKQSNPLHFIAKQGCSLPLWTLPSYLQIALGLFFYQNIVDTPVSELAI